ncbi:MAG: MATE family efflux transporter [Tissierellia bacterium]|nr:MATE family efflux transporter [Bacillota bacterium]NLL22385.1 MATE family efflux transporter [Tissierellia bacterium]
MEIFSKLFAPRDMTTGDPWKRILAFSFPLLLGNLAQQAYSAVDSMVVGTYVGDHALAAVGTSGPIIHLLIVFFVAISTGVGIMVSQYFGAKRKEDLVKTIGNCITITFIVSITLMALTPFITTPLLTFLGVPESIFNWSKEYLSILLGGVIGMSYYNILSGVLRGMGNSSSPLLYLLVASIINIVLDIYFVANMGLGVAGVAWATIIAQGVSALLCLQKLYRMQDEVNLQPHHLIPDKNYLLPMLRLGLPSGLTQAIFSTAQFFVQSLVNSFGEFYIAASLLVMRVDGFVMLPNFSFGMAMTTFTGQNVGAKRLDRVQQGTKQGLILSISASVTLTILVVLFGHHLMGLFTSTEELITYSVRMIALLIPGYVAMSITQVVMGVMRGSGDTLTPMWTSIITTVIIRLPLAHILAYLTKRPESIFVSLLCAWISGSIISSILYRRGKWRRSSIFDRQ